MTDRNGPFAARPRPAMPTAQALALFRDELTAAGFEHDVIRELLLVACEGEIRNDGLNVAAPTRM